MPKKLPQLPKLSHRPARPKSPQPKSPQSKSPKLPAPQPDPNLPLISVIVPVYNTPKTIERCLLSIWAQTYPHLEVILVDDGSTDISGDICDRLATRDPRTRVLHQPNQGLSGARNAGLAACRGQFVTFVDADDTVSPHLLSDLHRLIQRHHTKIAISALSELYPDGRERLVANPHLPTRLSTERALKAMLAEDGFTMAIAGKLFARSLFKHIEFPLGKLHEDVGTTYRLLLACPEIAYTARPLYYYHQNPTSITHQTFRRQKLDLITLTDQMCDDLQARYPSLDPDLRRRRCHARFSILRQLVLVSPRQQPAAEFTRQTGLSPDEFYHLRQDLVRYLRDHQNDILKNPTATRRDRLAMSSLLLGLPVFTAAWRLYASLYKS